MKFDFQARKFLVPVVILGSAVFAVACGDDDNAAPTKPPVVGDEDAGGGGDDADGGDATDDGDQTTEGNATDNSAEPSGDASVDTGEPTTGGDAAVATSEEPVTTDGVNTAEPSEDGGTTDEPQGCVENDEACFSCPTTPEEFLKQCTEGECKAFDNAGRLGRYVVGEPLPEP